MTRDFFEFEPFVELFQVFGKLLLAALFFLGFFAFFRLYVREAGCRSP